MRVAVHPGTSVVRVARAGPGGAPRVVEVPAEPGVPLPVLLRGLFDGASETVLVGRAVALPGRVVTVEAAVAVAAGRAEVLVVDVGASATEVCLVRGGRVVARGTAAGGNRFDRVVAALLAARDPARARAGDPLARARRIREAASLGVAVSPGAAVSRGAAVSPGEVGGPVTASEVRAALAATWTEVVGVAGAVAARPDVPVLLVGGGARTPDLAERLDAAGFVDVTVVPRPDAAAVLAALDLPTAPPQPAPPPTALRGTAPAGERPPHPGSPWPPPARDPARRPGRTLAGAVAVAVVLGALHVLGRLVEPGPEPPPGGVLAQYGYRLALPPGWAHTGGLPERRRSLLTPVAAPEGSDLIAVESTPLGYDASAEPRRASAELRAEFDAAGPALSEYDPDARFGGRAVTAYRERDGVTQVRWYVVLDGDTQLSVGCRHTPSGAAAVAAACAEVVATIRGG